MQTLHKNKKDETSSSSNSNSNNNMKLDEEIQDHMRDVSMARKIEELKQFQEKVHENPEEFEQDIQEQIEAESQLIEEEGGEWNTNRLLKNMLTDLQWRMIPQKSQ